MVVTAGNVWQLVGEARDAAAHRAAPTTKNDAAQTPAVPRCSYRAGKKGRTVKALQRLRNFRADQNLEKWVDVGDGNREWNGCDRGGKKLK